MKRYTHASPKSATDPIARSKAARTKQPPKFC